MATTESVSSTDRLEQALLLRMHNATAAMQRATRDAQLGFESALDYTSAMARSRHKSTEDMPQFMPTATELFHLLDLEVARATLQQKAEMDIALTKAEMLRTGSVGAHLVQQAFYWRVAQSPAIQQVCEVGFNAGHSSGISTQTCADVPCGTACLTSLCNVCSCNSIVVDSKPLGKVDHVRLI
jgi:hypothetical protein